MTKDEKLAAILKCVQTDPGNRGLARDPHDNLFTATAGDFERACRSIADRPSRIVALTTGFYIPAASPAAFETDGPLGVVFLQRALFACNIYNLLQGEGSVNSSLDAARDFCDFPIVDVGPEEWFERVHVFIERSGPSSGGRHYTMRGVDVTEYYDAGFTKKHEAT